VEEDGGAEGSGDAATGGVAGHDPHVADRGRSLDDVAEHRQGDLAAELLREPALALSPERDHDEHRRRRLDTARPLDALV
jgi:hypothetical protein